MTGRSKRKLYPTELNKDNLFKQSPTGGSAPDNQLRSIAMAEKVERDAKTARLRALRLANAKI